MGVAKPLASAALRLIKRGAATAIPGKKALKLSEPLLAEVSAWLRGEVEAKPVLSTIYRGVLTNTKGFESSSEFTHATPWASVASRGGKGGFGEPKAHKVFAFEANPGMKFYRGGSLAGDPLEETRILNSQGMTWDEALDNAREVYFTEITRAKADVLKRIGNNPDLEYMLEGLEKQVSENVAYDFMRATLETDLGGKSGIWEGQHVPPELNRRRPRLRSYDDLRKYLDKLTEMGFSKDYILNRPEAKILNRE